LPCEVVAVWAGPLHASLIIRQEPLHLT
jgi:hypothetical protein